MAMDSDRNENNEFQRLQRVNNIATAAYTEFAQRAFERIENFRGMISVDELVLNIFRQTPLGKRVEFSIASAVIPISPLELRCILFDTAAWRPLWPQIVHEARSFLPTADLQRLSESFGEGSSHFPAEFLQQSGEWSCIIKVHARLLLPTPTVPIREYSFLRYQKQIQEDIWAITDVSADYLDVLDPEAEVEYRRRPSGIVVREMGAGCCEVTWVENMEVPTRGLAQDHLFSTMLNSDMAFNAGLWVSALLQRIKQRESDSSDCDVAFDCDADFASEHNIQQMDNDLLCQCLKNQVMQKLLESATCMEMEFFQTISAEPNEKEFSIVIDGEMRIMKDIILDKSPNLIAIASIYVPAAPLLVYDFLVQKGLNLLKDEFENGENKPKEVLRYLGGDSCCVTLQRKLMEEEYVYMLQATRKNEFCSFMIANEMDNESIGDMFSYRVATEKGKSKSAAWDLWRPTGFAIMPDGFKGLESNASIVTVAISGSFDDVLEGEAVIKIIRLMSATCSRINRNFGVRQAIV